MDLNTGSGEKTEEKRSADSGEEFDYRNPVESFIGAVRGTAASPVGFFAGMARRGDYVNPTAFALICLEIYVVFNGIVWIFGAMAGFGGVGEAFGSLFLGIVIAPFAGAMGLFLRAGIFHLLTRLIIKPEATGFEATLRASAYSLTPMLVGWVPIIGPIIAGIWSTVLAVIGIREAHSTSTGKAAAVVLIPVAVAVAVTLILALIIRVFIYLLMREMGV
ncbi:MAG: YIP1 family protein [Rubrobacteraceae bacterium]